MALKAFQIHRLAEHFDQYKGQRTSKIIQYGKDVFSFRLQRAGRVVLVLDNQNPLVFIGGNEDGKTSLSTNASALLRKKLSGAEFDGAEQINGDRVLKFRFIGTNDIFQEERFSIVLELIPTKANMALLDEQEKILFAYRPNSITDPRPIFHGILYEPPFKKDSFMDETGEFDVDAYFVSCHDVEGRLGEQRKANVFQDFFRELRAKIKSLKRKMAQIQADIDNGQKHLGDVEYGNYLLTYQHDIPVGANSFDFYGETVALNPLKSAVDNANDFFKKSKKAKNAVAMGKENLALCEKELLEAEQLLDFASSCDEETLTRLLKENGSGKQRKSEKHHLPKTNHDLPYIAKIGSWVFYFGRSAKQNDYLSFLYATKPDYLWFHVKNKTGAHVILPYSSPDKQAIQYACEIALLATSMIDGEVQYTEHRNIRKGSVGGQVILSSYSSAYIRNVSPEAMLAYAEAIEKGTHR